MGALLQVVLPVFLVIGFGYVARARGIISDAVTDGLMTFAQKFAIPCLLFRAVSDLAVRDFVNLPLLGGYYAGALLIFATGFAMARLVFGRGTEDAVAIGFVCLFANSVLLGLPISERAFGAASLTPNFTIIAFHAPFCYGVGITCMEVLRARGAPGPEQLRRILKAMFSNAIILGITAGLIVSVTGLPVPAVVNDAADMLGRAALPAALFGLGGILVRYRPEGDMPTILAVCAVSLVLHPALTFGITTTIGLPVGELRAAVLTAAMPPGVNAFLFATMYARAQRVAASSVLIATGASVVSVWLWLLVLP
ncbi:AEC family transporter [Pseudaestuariivita atlantica]|uniref:Malonate transporter n=1 Tax=Pseudaestuariivita atlantica TaxID=1317121 RepID=A0A0L1JTJ8_9RHOB|nr:AEC family transporter [Pseudaestuariivita atlantica]KNG95099.1 malonate transporter [Pseudaestuariivita atlantica]